MAVHGVASPVPCPPGTRIVETAFPAGREQWCGREGSGVRHGPYRAWDAGGRLKIDGHFLDGQKAGRWRFWHGNGLWPGRGQPSEEGDYAAGRETGTWTRWHRNGARFEEGEYRAGQRQGRWTAWYDNGEVMTQGQYRDSAPYGVWTRRSVIGEECEPLDLGPPRAGAEPVARRAAGALLSRVARPGGPG